MATSGSIIARKRYWRNRNMSLWVTLAGWLILLMLANLIWHLISNSLPLLSKPKATPVVSMQLPDMQLIHLGDLMHGGVMVMQDRQCQLHFYHFNGHQQLEPLRRHKHPCGNRFTSIVHQAQPYLISLSKSGIVRVEQLFASTDIVRREQLFSFAIQRPDRVTDWQVSMSDDYLLMALRDQDNNWQTYWVKLTDPSQLKRQVHAHIEKLLLLPQANRKILIDQQSLQVRDPDNRLIQQIGLPAKLTFLQALPSQRSFLLGLENGQYQQWSLINQSGEQLFQPIYAPAFAHNITQLVSSAGANTTLAIGAQQQVYFYSSSTGEIIRQQPLIQPASYAVWHAGLLYGISGRQLNIWSLSGVAGFTSWNSLFGKNWYEGYQKPAYVWQSSAASDHQQSKYSLIPLFIGSIKAAMLALVIAIPVAISAAVYTAYFAPGGLRNWLKPAIELLEAVPSVVIGFIAAVWLTPLSETLLLPMVLFILLVPLSLFVLSFGQARMLKLMPLPLRRNWEILFASLLLLLLLFLVFSQAEVINYQLTSWLDWQGNKSTLIVALALGIAIAPSIYSVAEDAIHGVPEQIKNASFALGATRLQTLQRVVLTVSLPGILSAITLGFGRAFGETMILLMVSGNTPISEWNLVSSIRALTANLAIELPEAQPGSELYHILFFTALLLFGFTFLINGLAEWLRVRLRKNYQYA